VKKHHLAIERVSDADAFSIPLILVIDYSLVEFTKERGLFLARLLPILDNLLYRQSVVFLKIHRDTLCRWVLRSILNCLVLFMRLVLLDLCRISHSECPFAILIRVDSEEYEILNPLRRCLRLINPFD
jgi:hypothetical protein